MSVVNEASSNALQPAAVAAGEGIVVPLGDHSAIWKVSAEQSGGAFLFGEAHVDYLGGVPPHVHTREDECFYVLEGRFEFLAGTTVTVANPGDTMFLPRNVVHAWRCISEQGGKAIGVITPGANFQEFAGKMAAKGCDPAANMADPATLAEFTALAAEYGINMVPPVK